MLRRKVAVLLGKPLQRDLGFSAPAGRNLDRSKPLSVLRADRGLELGTVRAQQAPEPSNRNPKIMERLGVVPIVEPSLCGSGRRKALERQSPRRLLVTPEQKIVGQAAPPLGMGKAPRTISAAKLDQTFLWNLPGLGNRQARHDRRLGLVFITA